MLDMMAIISKAVFEKESAGRSPGDVLPLHCYRSASRFLEPLNSGGRLFLVTVRPPNESLWLVAVLEGLKFQDSEWHGEPNRVPITDITALLPRIRFESGKGISAAKGALGMSLQTPRVLAPGDVELLLQAASGKSVQHLVNLTAHEASTPLPCLCKRCFADSDTHAEAGGMRFTRAQVETEGRVLYYWLPEELGRHAKTVAQSVRGALDAHLGR